MNSSQDESSVRRTSSEKDDSDFMCPESGVKTQASTCVKSTGTMMETMGNVNSSSAVRCFSRTQQNSNITL